MSIVIYQRFVQSFLKTNSIICQGLSSVWNETCSTCDNIERLYAHMHILSFNRWKTVTSWPQNGNPLTLLDVFQSTFPRGYQSPKLLWTRGRPRPYLRIEPLRGSITLRLSENCFEEMYHMWTSFNFCYIWGQCKCMMYHWTSLSNNNNNNMFSWIVECAVCRYSLFCYVVASYVSLLIKKEVVIHICWNTFFAINLLVAAVLHRLL